MLYVRLPLSLRNVEDLRVNGKELFWDKPDCIDHYRDVMGVGTQIIYVDPENDLVVVARWIEQEKVSEFLRMVLASIEK